MAYKAPPRSTKQKSGEDSRRAVVAASRRAHEALSLLSGLVSDADVPVGDVRLVMRECRALSARVTVLGADAASVVSAREGHRDGGVAALAHAGGLSRREAAGQVCTARGLRSMPDVLDAVEGGEISFANAGRLVDACQRTSSEEVAADTELLEMAVALPVEVFAKEAGRWAAARQHDDDAERRYRRQRSRRRLSLWDSEDGMVHLRGELDPLTGARLRNRLFKEAERLRRTDLDNEGVEQRLFSQRMADALETLTAEHRDCDNPSGSWARGGTEIMLVQHLDAAGQAAISEIAGGSVIPRSVIQEHMGNSPITGLLFNNKGHPLWRGDTIARPTKAQRDALRARYGGCAGCGADYVRCQFHHIKPLSEGGTTDIDNLIVLCWACHQRIHRHGWRVARRGKIATIEPPDSPDDRTLIRDRARALGYATHAAVTVRHAAVTVRLAAVPAMPQTRLSDARTEPENRSIGQSSEGERRARQGGGRTVREASGAARAGLSRARDGPDDGSA